MQAPTSLIAEIEDAFHCGSGDKRTVMLTRITDLFVGDADSFDDAQVGLFDDVFAHLIDEIETQALTELARRLATIDNAPPKVIRRLAAHQEIDVAGPVLRRARRLDDDSLVGVAKIGSQDHLLAISVRPQVSEPVTDVLVDRGNSTVVHSIAANAGARFSQIGLAALVKHAEGDADLAGAMIERRDIPPQLFCKLLLQATEVVRQRLLARAQPETRDLIQQVLSKVAGDMAAKAAAPRDYAGALRDLLARYPGGKIGEADLREIASRKRPEEMIAALSLVAVMPVDAIDRVLRVDKVGPIVILGKASGFAWPTIRAIVEAGSAIALSPHKLGAARVDFERLSVSSAQRVLHMWQVRGAGAQN
jgi:uncharacterized protein (DUF2336 family)